MRRGSTDHLLAKVATVCEDPSAFASDGEICRGPLRWFAMFRLFGNPRPPLSTFQRLDIELLLRKSIDVWGADRVRSVELVGSIDELPIDKSSPATIADSSSQIVAEWFDLARSPLPVSIKEWQELGYNSVYKDSEGEPSIVLADTIARDPLRAVIETAYQYSLHYWKGQASDSPLDTDPRTTNLLPICLGLGILASDASLYDEQWKQAGFQGWSVSRSGYYNTVELGYVLALFARFRGESSPAWFRNLRLDSKVTAKKAQQYFADHEKQGHQLLFDADKIPRSDMEPGQLANWLAGDDPAFALAAAFALVKQDEFPPLVIDAALKATNRNDPDLTPVAVRLLAGARHDSEEVAQRVRGFIRKGTPATSVAAVETAHAIGLDLNPFQNRISHLLDANADDAYGLLKVIGDQGSKFGKFDIQICHHIVEAIRLLDEDLVKANIDCLRRVSEDPEATLRKNVRNAELLSEALDALRA